MEAIFDTIQKLIFCFGASVFTLIGIFFYVLVTDK